MGTQVQTRMDKHTNGFLKRDFQMFLIQKQAIRSFCTLRLSIRTATTITNSNKLTKNVFFHKNCARSFVLKFEKFLEHFRILIKILRNFIKNSEIFFQSFN